MGAKTTIMRPQQLASGRGIQAGMLLFGFFNLLVIVHGASVPQSIADAHGAKCLDGTAPTYDIVRNCNSDKWVLFFEGGSWCGDRKSCANRVGWIYPKPADEDLVSPDPGALPKPANGKAGHFGTADLGGLMSQDAAINPDFHDWNKVFLHYCDGASFSSSRQDPIDVFTRGGASVQMWFRGRQNFNALVAHLQTSLGMEDATEVILSGGSSGGLAVFYNIDHLASLLPAGVRLTGFPDGGFFIDAKNRYGAHAYQKWFKHMDVEWNTTSGGGTNKACLAAADEGEEWKCLMAPYIAPHIQTPLYVMNSPFDSFSTSAVLWAQCIPAPGITCTTEQTELLKEFHAQFKADIQKAIRGNEEQAARNGIYAPCCYVHEQNVNYCSFDNFSPNCAGWSAQESGSKKWGYHTSVEVSDGRSLTPQQAFGAWYKGDDPEAGNVVDTHEFFDNPTCAYNGKAPVIPGYPVAGTAVSDSLPCSTSDTEAPSVAPIELDPVASGCHKVWNKNKCLSSQDGRSNYNGQACMWCCGTSCLPGYTGKKCQPSDWLAGAGKRKYGWNGEGQNGLGVNTCASTALVPSSEPTSSPSHQMHPAVPTRMPTAQHTEEPTAQHTEEPTPQHTEEPTAQHTEEPTAQHTGEPTAQHTEEPTRNCFKMKLFKGSDQSICKKALVKVIKSTETYLNDCQKKCMTEAGCKMFSFKETANPNKKNICRLCKSTHIKKGKSFHTYENLC